MMSRVQQKTASVPATSSSPQLVPQRRSAGRSARQLRRFYERLVAEFGPQQWWPAHSALEVVVGAYLTQNTSWLGVERSIANLKAAGALNVDVLREVPEEQLRVLIRPSGFMLRKAAAIKAFANFLHEGYRGSLTALAAEDTESARKKLLSLPGVGPETADAILLYALGHPVMVVDEYLRRVTTRHGLVPPTARYAEIQQLAVAAFAADPPSTRMQHYNEFHALIVQIGKRHCSATPRCEGCPLNAPAFHPPERGAQKRRATRREQAIARS